jgi:hypothetical protein
MNDKSFTLFEYRVGFGFLECLADIETQWLKTLNSTKTN